MKYPHIQHISDAALSGLGTKQLGTNGLVHSVITDMNQDQYFQDVLDDSIQGIQEFLNRLQRRKKFITKQVPYRKLIPDIITKSETGDVGIKAPFLEERQLEPESNYHIKKVSIPSQKIVIKHKPIQVEIPPNPIKLDINIPFKLLKQLEGSLLKEDIKRRLRFVILLFNSLHNVISSESIHINICIIGDDISSSQQKIVEEGFLLQDCTNPNFKISFHNYRHESHGISIFSKKERGESLLYHPGMVDSVGSMDEGQTVYIHDSYSVFVKETVDVLKKILIIYFD